MGLRDQFTNHSAKRNYVALVWGNPELNIHLKKKKIEFCLEKDKTYRLSGKIGRHPFERTKMAIRNDNNGKHAITRFKIIEKFNFKNKTVACLIECWLETGRTHQIRVHMDSINHGIVGDPIYRSGKKTDTVLINNLGDGLIYFKRQALHARNLSFTHPITSEYKNFNTSLPNDLQKLIDSFYKLSTFE